MGINFPRARHFAKNAIQVNENKPTPPITTANTIFINKKFNMFIKIVGNF